MGKYVTANLHGNAFEFFNLLKSIKFSPSDELYIVGDIFDRGPDSLVIYDFIKQMPNIFFIIGNHEEHYVKLYEAIINNTEYINEYNKWILDDGFKTLKAINKNNKDYADELYKYLKDAPNEVIIGNYLLAHSSNKLSNSYKNKFIKIFGHVEDYITNNGKIIHDDRAIYINIKSEYYKKLGCLRLDDMEEFYVNLV